MILAARSATPERMDTDCVEYEDYRRCLRDLARVNRITFTARPTLAWLGRQALRPGEAFTVLDVASGHGDMLRAIRRWCDRRGLDPVLIGVDLNPFAVRAAREATPETDRISFVQGDALAFRADRPIDFIITAQFTHHLADPEIVAFLRWMEASAARGWLVSDLQRSVLAYGGFAVLATLAGWHKVVRGDGLISITRSFHPDELAALVARAGLDGIASVRRHVPFRLTVERRR